MKRTWLNQFGAEYAVPMEVLNHPGIVDQSWGNDAAPSFTLKRYERDGDLPAVTLWVEHPDQSAREWNGWNRFIVVQGHDIHAVEIYNGDDVAAALAALERGTP